MAASTFCITHASELLTGAGIRARDGVRPEESDLGRIDDGALVYTAQRIKIPGRGTIEVPGRIVWVGQTSKLPRKYLKTRKQNLKQERALIPGLVDCHTHLIFAGDRADEFARRCAGATYAEIADQGGGIQKTVHATRQASRDELLRLATARVKESLAYGVKTLEIKSGYGLSHENELKILRVIQSLKRKFPDVQIESTYLGAHDFPKSTQQSSRKKYIQEICNKTLPELARLKLASACDVFIDDGYYTVPEAREILKRAQSLRLQVKVHADELTNTESAAFAANRGALSADHLLKISSAGIEALARSQTVAVLLPGTALYLNTAQAPARRLIDAGVRVAISTDFNPGTCMTLNLPAVMTIAALQLGLSRAEIFASVTYNAARALGLHGSCGTIEPGMAASVTVLPFRRFEESYYRFAWR